MKDKKNGISTIKIKTSLDRFVEKNDIVECLICDDIFYSSHCKSHPCLKSQESKRVVKLEEHEKEIFNDPVKLEKLLNLKPVVNFFWKYPNHKSKNSKEKKKTKIKNK